jgi:hypothetical protein
MRRDQILIGALLTAGGTAVLIAAFLPSLYAVWTARGVSALTTIGQHRGTWQLANWLFALGAGLTLAGLAALTGLLNHEPATTSGRPATLPSAAFALIGVASTLWLANLAFRLAVTVRVADTVTGGGATPDWYEHINAFTSGLWSAAALVGALALICYGLAVADGAALPGWTGWFAIGTGALMLVLFLVTRDVPPFLLYLAPTAFGITALVRAHG